MKVISRPDYTFAEKTADGVIHVLGIVFAVVACADLVRLIQVQTSRDLQVGLGAYAIGLAAMLSCSALYNFANPGIYRKIFRRLDHAAIFFMIAGTYSPFSLVTLHGTLRVVLLSMMWCLAVGGAALKLSYPRRFERLSVSIYLLLGWSGLIAIHSWVAAVPATSLIFLAIGGALYSLGVVFHLNRKLPYHNAIWHLFVLVAAVCHFIAITKMVEAA